MGKGTRYPHVEMILRNHYAQVGGKVLEMGAGGAVYKDIFYDYIGTDLPTNPYSAKGDLDIYCDAQYLPFQENTFDMAFVVGTLYLIRDIDLVLSEIKRVLKPRGHLLVFDYNKKTLKRIKATGNEGNNFCHVWSPRELKRIIQNAGFYTRIIKSWSKVESSKVIYKALIRILPDSILFLIRNLFFEGWNIVVATKIG